MRYAIVALTIGIGGIVSGCTTSYLGSVGSSEPGYLYAGYGPAFLEEGNVYGFSPRAPGTGQTGHPRPPGNGADR